MASSIVTLAPLLRSFFMTAHVAEVAAISITTPAHKGKIFHPIVLTLSVIREVLRF